MTSRCAIQVCMALVVSAAALAAANCLDSLSAADRLYRQGDYAGAETILRSALNDARSLPPDDARRAIILNNLGSVYHFLNKYPQAEQCYRRAVEIEDRLWGTAPDRPIRSVLNLAAFYVETGQYEKAERLRLGPLAENQFVSRRNDSDFARLLALLGALERRQASYSSAEQHLEHALEILQQLAPDSTQVLETLNNLCVLHGEVGRNTDALSCCERALRIAERMRDPVPSIQASLLANIGAFQFLLHGAANAEPFYKRALLIGENAFGGEHPLLAQILLSYAVLLEKTNRKVEAREFRRRARSILREASELDEIHRGRRRSGQKAVESLNGFFDHLAQ